MTPRPEDLWSAWPKTASPFDPYGQPVTDRGNPIPRGEYYRPGNQQRFLDEFRRWELDKLLDERQRIQGPPLKGIAWPGANYNKALQQAIQERTQQPGQDSPSTHPAMQNWYDQGLDEAEQSVLPQGLARTAAETRQKLMERAQQWPDYSETVHELPGGYTVRRPTNYQDIHRTGELMGNCWSANDPACTAFDYHPHWPTYESNGKTYPVDSVEYLEDRQHANLLANLDQPLNRASQRRWLADPNGIPHTVWWEDNNGSINEALGRHNSLPKPEYQDLVRQYAQANGRSLDESDWQALQRWQDTQPLDDHQAHIYTRSLNPYQPLVQNAGTRASGLMDDMDDLTRRLPPNEAKCPNCQHVPFSLMSGCPSCGYVLNDDGAHAPDSMALGWWGMDAPKQYGGPGYEGPDFGPKHFGSTVEWDEPWDPEPYDWEDTDDFRQGSAALHTCVKCGTAFDPGQMRYCPKCGLDATDPSDPRTATTPQTYYHVAPQEARDSILTNGLDHTLGQRGTDYGGYIANEPGNYLWASEEHARNNLASKHDFDGTRPWDLYQVDANGLNLRPDQEWGGCHYTPEPIGPERLRLVTDQHTSSLDAGQRVWTPDGQLARVDRFYTTLPGSQRAVVRPIDAIDPHNEQHHDISDLTPETETGYGQAFGDQIQHLHELAPGDLLYAGSGSYTGEPNVLRVHEVRHDDPSPGFTWQFVNPAEPMSPRLPTDSEHFTWANDIPTKGYRRADDLAGGVPDMLPPHNAGCSECYDGKPCQYCTNAQSSLPSSLGTARSLAYNAVPPPRTAPISHPHVGNAPDNPVNAPYTQPSPHLLTWQPSDGPGRGIVEANGRIHTWPEDWGTHGQYAHANDLEPGWAPFGISHDQETGQTQPYGNVMQYTPLATHITNTLGLKAQRYSRYRGKRVDNGCQCTCHVTQRGRTSRSPCCRFCDRGGQLGTHERNGGGPSDLRYSAGPIHEALAGGTVTATYTADPAQRLVTIEEWTSLDRGQGNTAQALQELRQRYPGYAIIAFDAVTLGAESYWRQMKAKGLIDDFTDEWGEVLSKVAGPMNEDSPYRVARPVDPEWWEQFDQPLYHGTQPGGVKGIQQKGLIPWDDPEHPWGSNYDEGEWIEPRPGHTYLTTDPEKAMEVAGDNDAGSQAIFQVDPRALDPARINPDEDHMMDVENRAAPRPPTSLGDLAEQVGWGDDPAVTQEAIQNQGDIAYKGRIPPEAMKLYYQGAGPLSDGTDAGTPMRYFHSTEAELQPGDTIHPASKGYESDSHGMPGYDPNYVYVFDQRQMTHPEYDPMYPNSLSHTYEVEPLGPLEQDPEGEELRKQYGDDPVNGPEWYHPYNWRTTHARVIGPMDWEDPGLQPRQAAYDPDLASDALGCPKCGQPIQPTYKPDSTWVPHFRCEHCGFDAPAPGESGAIGTPYTPEEKLEAWEHVMTSPAFDADPLLVKPQNWDFGPARQGARSRADRR